MDNRASAMFRESLKKEADMRAIWLKETDTSNAKPIPPEFIYQSSSIAQIPLEQDLISPAKGFKPVQNVSNFHAAKKSYGMYGNDRTQFSRVETFKAVPPELRATEYYGKPSPTKEFYRRSGAFNAVEQ